MNTIKKFISFIDDVPENKELSIRQQVTLVLWVTAIILIPFFRFPYGVFERLSLYPILLIAFINIDQWWNLCRHNKFLRYTAFAIAAFIAWKLISLPLSTDLNDIDFAGNLLSSLNETVNYGAWYIFMATCFLFPKEKIAGAFYCGFTVSMLYCCAYSVIEILHWCKVQWATDFLSKSIYYFIANVGEYCGWYPPVFWDSPRLRSVYQEPSNFAVLSTFSILFYGFCAWQSAKWSRITVNVLLMILSVLALCGTRSASGTLALASSSIFFIILFAVFFRKFNKSEKIKGSVLSLLLLVFAGMAALNQRGGITDWQLLFNRISATPPPATQVQPTQQPTPKVQPTQQPATQVQPTQQPEQKFNSSSGTRLIHLKTELLLIAERPFAGCGQGNYGQVMKQALLENPEKSDEIRLWSENAEYIPPRLNKYTAITVEYGIIGLLLFIAIFSPAIFYGWHNLKTASPASMAALTLCVMMAIIISVCPINILFYSIFLTVPLSVSVYGNSVKSKKNDISA